MRHAIENWLLLSIATICLALSVLPCAAQQSDSINLPGHLFSETEILKNPPAIAIATLKSNGRADLGSVGRMKYSYVKLTVEETLTGAATTEITGTYTCTTDPITSAETVPTVGEKYIIFFEKGQQNYPGQTYSILKFSAYSVEEFNKLKRMLAQPK